MVRRDSIPADTSDRAGQPYPATQGAFVTFLRDFWNFLKARKKYWLLPMMLILLLFGLLLVLTGGTAVAPFIYTLF